MIAKDKRSSLFTPFVNNEEEKSFITFEPGLALHLDRLRLLLTPLALLQQGQFRQMTDPATQNKFFRRHDIEHNDA